ncbi:aspartyl/glutamyl-tRNA(Asn/Gln) amidotransferase subunit A [Caloranaerobacter azorensis DSM 13643]|uniref:Glutamyl-tRNA(Gln) amidotransferase subunit A n=1 Tax=Caloranaerobacter azorensis DSM 13643 TaxID=1121264 RepID=A0A1M5UTN1_9FIRM|nr:Asp-tRNA(Asn)/Glu-tRNA(Gln) amidotransferase subunit GatA [Caloranaerobacter azorensis]SHH66295.1 aspartyl/glutamyl-tRNA(Asn/Gln) amidotransferase subunit A [Caloranaerobacter azorensis DSM 13643]
MDLINLTIHELRDLIRNREVSSEEIVRSFLSRIEKLEDKVGSFITLTKEKAIEDARKIDKKIKEDISNLSDLAGIPVGIKDNIVTEGIKTTCGSRILKNFIPPYDATVVKRLKLSDAIIIGKTNMDEFAMGSSTENSAFKITKNPWDLNKVPGGSSGGSAAAVSASLVPYALGSSTGGSIRQPAAFCGIVGLKPTYGLVSRYGLVAFASSFDQIGPLTKDVEDCAIVLNSIIGFDKKDSTSVDNGNIDYTKALMKDIRGIKVALPKEYFDDKVDNRIKEKVLDAVKVLEKLGAKIDYVSLPFSEYALATYYILAPSEASSNLARFDGVRYGERVENYNSVEELIVKTRTKMFGDEVKRRIMIGTYFLSSSHYSKYYKKAQQMRTLIIRDFERVFRDFDIIISPTTPTLPYEIGEKKLVSMYFSDVLTVSANIVGIPAITLPCGYIDGLPVGMQILGKIFGEIDILSVAYAYEKNSDFQKRIPEIKEGIKSGV